ncbi:AAA family ATPase [Methylophaga sp. OBS3]|uniref:AAA family ATPase n=1 Tax=Methylophaga sp. OBS3 TaxID=2991934 RepID=UPI00224D0550|nr:AAA family ATPase [Methylophaga sp. OBS3]MCX4189924.1 AAA family ATPase [Methylophaga sp. OBS3]
MTEMHATAEPAYLDRLALHSNPFSRQNLPGSFFAGRQVSQRLNLILHLLRSSSQICLLHAADGLGKSSLLRAVQQRAGEDLRFCLLTAGENISLATITQQCLQAFGSTGDTQLGGDQQQLLRQRLQQLSQIQITPVLLLDDADKLDSSIQQQLATWLHWQHEGQYLLKAVVATNNITAIQNIRNDRFQELELLPVATDEIPAYLLQRLQAAGWQDDLPFTDKQLQRIQKRSNGIPSEINHQAHQQLLGVNRSWQLPALPSWRMPKWIKWLPMLPVAIALLLLLIFQKNINEWLGQSQPTDNDVEEIIEAPELPMVVIDEDTVLTNAEAEKQNLIELLEELEETQSVESPSIGEPFITEQISTVEQASDSSDTQNVVEEESVVIPPFTPVDEMPTQTTEALRDTEVEKIETIVEVKTPEAKQSEQPKSVNKVHGADWIMEQPKTAFTFQLMGSWDRSEIDDYIKKYQLTGNVAVFASMRNNQVWYALIYGVYNSKNAAVQASAKWPKPLNGVSSWLRRFDGVQTQIRDKAPDA